MTQATLYLMSEDGAVALGAGVLHFAAAAAAAAEETQELLKLWEGGTISFTSTIRRPLRRLLLHADNRTCYICLRRFPGPWQQSKHARRAHRG